MIIKAGTHFPILHQKNYTKIKAVYRLEDSDGDGPFGKDQACSEFLKEHYDPEAMWEVLRKHVCKKTFSKKNLQECYGTMIFGWRTRQLYNRFFKKDGQAGALALGYQLAVYKPKIYIPLPDGQVMFQRP